MVPGWAREKCRYTTPINTCFSLLLLCSVLKKILKQLRQQDRVVQGWECRHLDFPASPRLDLPWKLGLSTTVFSPQFPVPSKELSVVEQDVMISCEGVYIICFGIRLDHWFL